MVKQVIVARKDLKMPPGKLAGQVAHASLGCILNKITFDIYQGEDHIVDFCFNKDEYLWINEDTDAKFTKVVLKVNSEQELLDIYEKAETKGLNVSLIKDAGNTVFKEPTYTCVGIGPAQSAELDEITSSLKLY